jgi:hypothetical protein
MRFGQANNVPVIIVSSGMEPLIRAVLGSLLGEETAKEIEIIANDVHFTDEAQVGETWEIVFRFVVLLRSCSAACIHSTEQVDPWPAVVQASRIALWTRQVQGYPSLCRPSLQAYPLFHG